MAKHCASSMHDYIETVGHFISRLPLTLPTKFASYGVRTHAELPPVDLKSTPLTTRANWHLMPGVHMNMNLCSMWPHADCSFCNTSILHIEVANLTTRDTVAILAQGTYWAIAKTQAFCF